MVVTQEGSVDDGKKKAVAQWVAVLEKLECRVSRKAFDTWILSLEPEWQGGELMLYAPIRLFANRIKDQFSALIAEAANRTVEIRHYERSAVDTASMTWRTGYERALAERRARRAAAESMEEPAEEEAPGKEEESVVEEPSTPVRSIERIIEVVAQVHQITTEELLAHDRRRSRAYPRHMATYFARKHTRESTPSIGVVMGDRHHTSIIRSVRTAEELLESDEGFAARAAEVKRLLGR